MKIFQWDSEKNEMLKKTRGVSFERVVVLMERGEILDSVEHPNEERYPERKIAVITIDDYVYLVSCIQNGEELFLKTIIPSRKATNKYVRTEQ